VRLADQPRSFFAHLLEPVTRGSSAEAIRAHACLAAIMRTLWSLVPERLISAASPDFRALASASLRERFRGDATQSETVVRHLSVIFKRIRQHALFGRRASSLDLELQAHR